MHYCGSLKSPMVVDEQAGYREQTTNFWATDGSANPDFPVMTVATVADDGYTVAGRVEATIRVRFWLMQCGYFAEAS